MLLAGACIVVAAFFLLRRDLDIAFVIAAIGMCAWFLNYRAQLKEITTAADIEAENRRDEHENVEDLDND
jgi:hypothetical protein